MAQLDRTASVNLSRWMERASTRSLPSTQVASIVLAAVEQIPPGETSAWLVTSENVLGPLDTVDGRRVTALLAYCYSHGVVSSRVIEAASTTDPAAALLAAQPRAHRELRAFRRAHRAALGAAFLEVFRRCAAMGLAKLGQVTLVTRGSPHGALDGERLIAEAEQEDREDDALLGTSEREPSSVDPLMHPASRSQRLRLVLAQLDAQSRARR